MIAIHWTWVLAIIVLSFSFGCIFSRALWRRDAKRDEAHRALVAETCENIAAAPDAAKEKLHVTQSDISRAKILGESLLDTVTRRTSPPGVKRDRRPRVRGGK